MNTDSANSTGTKTIESANLQSLSAYTCTRHPHKPAFCLCAKCGAMLCRDCNIAINGRRYCESCTMNDEALCHALEHELSQVSVSAAPVVEFKAPSRWTELPGAIANMCRDDYAFFKTAGQTPFYMSFALAFLALLPNSLILCVFKIEDLIQNFTQNAQMDEAQKNQILQALQMATTTDLVLTAIMFTALKIILLDLFMFISMRVFSKSEMTWSESGSILHYCLLPLGLVAIDSWFNVPFIRFLGLAFVIIELSTAIRSAARCTMWQNLFAMLSFVFMASLSRML